MTFKIKFKDIFGLWALFLQTQWVSAEFPWWEVEKNTEVEAFRCLRSSNLYLRRAPQIDLSGVHSCYEFKVTPFDRGGVTMDSGHFCYPSIIVTGVRKAVDWFGDCASDDPTQLQVGPIKTRK